jgi:hypothetical protein
VGFDPLTTTVVAGVQVTLQGWSDPGEHWYWNPGEQPPGCDFQDIVTYSGVLVTLDDGQQTTATNFDAQWAAWSAAVTFKQPGTHTAKAVASTTTGGSYSGKVVVQVHPAGPTITLTSPLTSSSVNYPLTVQAVPTLGTVVAMEYSLDDVTFLPMNYDPFGGYWQVMLEGLFTNPVPVTNPPSVTIWVRGGDASGTNTVSFQASAKDMTPPTIVSLEPANGSRVEILGSSGATQLHVKAQVTDDAHGAVSSGISSVTCFLDGVPQAGVSQSGSGDPEVWQGLVTVAQPGPHILKLTCTDNAGYTSITENQVVAVQSDVRDSSEQSYLADLIDFIGGNFTTTPSPKAGPPNTCMVTAAHLTNTLRQPFRRLTQVPAPLVDTPISALRGVVEVLRNYLTPTPAPPIGHWPLDEGSGTSFQDDTGAGSDGILVGATQVNWVPGPTGGTAPVFDGSDYVRVGTPLAGQYVGPPQLAVSSAGVTVTAWINPSGPGAANGSVIAGWDPSYLIGYFDDHTIGWALHTPSLNWAWVKTGIAAPQGHWSHVAVSYDGSSVRTYLNGALVHAMAASGAIIPSSTDQPFCIGNRPDVPGSLFTGAIADVGVYDRGLADYDIKLLLGPVSTSDEIWLDDALPAGVQTGGDQPWAWTTQNPPPYSGSQCHHSPTAAGEHQHLFFWGQPAPSQPPGGWQVSRGDRLYAYVYLDPASTPTEVMLQWADRAGNWSRAYWGEDDLAAWAEPGVPSSMVAMGPLPPVDRWVRLEVPAAAVGLELDTVTGLAFTLFGGQAWWDLSGKTSGAGLAAANGYAAAAYQALLTGVGTSWEELRTARGASPAARAALAARLGITLSTSRPDQLDQLLLPPATVTEAGLQQLFGLAPTDTNPPSSPAGTPQLLGWQQQSLYGPWAAQDHATVDPHDYTAPVIDPDIVTPSDFRDTTTAAGQAALGLWQARATFVATQMSTLAKTQSAGLSALLSHQLAGFDLAGTAAAEAEGKDITAALAAVPIDYTSFERLVTLSTLSGLGPLTDDEWADAVAIVVQVLKVRNFPAWRTSEANALPGLGVFLDPAVFQVTPIDPATLPAWRAPWPARLTWQNRLTARTAQLGSLAAALAQAVAFAEQAALPVLRDALVAVLTPPGAVELSTQLCIDLQVGPAVTTTPLDQAVEALQGVLYAVDPGGTASGVGLPWTLGPATFDAFVGELTWMGSYTSWQAAINVFFYPENHLLPSIRPSAEMTPAFVKLIADMTALTAPPMTEQFARTAAQAYWKDLTSPPGPTSPPTGLPMPGPGGQYLYPYTEQLNEAQLSQLQAIGQQNNSSTYKSLLDVPNGVREVFFDLPVQLATSLNQAGQHQAALGWLRTVYDYLRPAGQREIFFGFALEPGSSGPVTRGLDWLEEGELNPHDFAATRPHAYLWFTVLAITGCLCDWADSQFAQDTAESRSLARALYQQALNVLTGAAADTGTTDPTGLPPNPQLATLTAGAQGGLAKLRAGLNIAGLARPLSTITGTNASAVAIPPPTSYRYATLFAQAEKILNGGAQLEQAYLNSVERTDQENYNLRVAGQDMGLAQRQVTLANDQSAVAEQNVTVAQTQVQRAQTQSQTYQQWLTVGPNSYERAQLTDYQQESGFRQQAADTQQQASIINGVVGVFTGVAELASENPMGLASVMQGVTSLEGASAAQSSGQADQAAIKAQSDALQASMERRTDEWKLAKSLADIDTTISQQQVNALQTQAVVAGDQAAIAAASYADAKAKLGFLQQKFTSAALYQWMSGVLGGTYRYMLQQATATARLAEQQLAFERQLPSPGFIKTDYWTVTGAPVATGGLTGSARLLADLTALDEYASQTDRRKLQLTQTTSLAALSPVDVQQFRQTGVLPFATPMQLFQRGLPGLYLATIHQVRVSVIALVPPEQGIRALLSNGGTSRIVVSDGGVYRTETLVRPAETVAFTAPANATGVFSVDLQPDLLLPFEGSGIDTTWELRMPKAANPFDFRTIADVQIAIDYTALYSPGYAAAVTGQLPTTMSNSIGFSLRNDFPDSWYTLVNQAQSQPPPTTPLIATYALTQTDFPPNLSGLAVENVTLLVIRQGSDPPSFGIDHLKVNGAPTTSTAAVTVGDIVTTRNSSGANWIALRGLDPAATWELGLTPDPSVIAAITQGSLQDLVLVISYQGTLPPWPD